ncbi:MAG TPA: MarR family transcriptional regulator [Clostridia bacterium]|nr:MarR family transcriptional regulator [Clostridia bacterium]
MSKQLPTMARIGTIFLTWRRYQQRDILSHKITLKQLYVLRQLARKDFLYPSQIADMLYCDRPTATVVIGNMTREGWVTREKDPENAKQIRVSLTEKGRNKLLAIDNDAASREGSAFDPLSCFSAEEKNQLDLLLTKLSKHLSKLEG